jgi:cell wall-associated NlpC family hydrolase
VPSGGCAPMTLPTPSIAADPAAPATNPARDANAHNGEAVVGVRNGHSAIDNGAPMADVDTDGDGITAGIEVQFGNNPLEMDAGTGYHPPPPVAPVVAAAAPAVPLAAPPPATPAIHGQLGATGSVQLLIDVAMAQVGDDYAFGAEVAETDPDPQVWDCAEFTQWSADQVGAEIPGSSFEQYLDLKAKGLLIPVEQGMNTPGALLFHFSSEPEPGGGRPSQAHVARSLGGDRTVQAQSEDVGVITDDAGGRFEYAALLPTVDYAGDGGEQPDLPDGDADPGVDGASDAGGLTQEMVIYGIKMPESRGDYQAENPTSTASGAYQYIDGTWADYQGYPGVDISDPGSDSDNDGLTNHFEQLIGSNPILADSDLDGLIDGFDTTPGTDPMTMDTDPAGAAVDLEMH